MVVGAAGLLEGLAEMLRDGLPSCLAEAGAVLEAVRDVCVPGRRCRTLPYLSLALRGADVGEKDRIIDTEVYGVEIWLHICRRRGNAAMRGLRYMDALRAFFARNEWCGLWDRARVTGYDVEHMTVRVEREYIAGEGGVVSFI